MAARAAPTTAVLCVKLLPVILTADIAEAMITPPHFSALLCSKVLLTKMPPLFLFRYRVPPLFASLWQNLLWRTNRLLSTCALTTPPPSCALLNVNKLVSSLSEPLVAYIAPPLPLSVVDKLTVLPMTLALDCWRWITPPLSCALLAVKLLCFTIMTLLSATATTPPLFSAVLLEKLHILIAVVLSLVANITPPLNLAWWW